jgi:hypothetical protein
MGRLFERQLAEARSPSDSGVAGGTRSGPFAGRGPMPHPAGGA